MTSLEEITTEIRDYLNLHSFRNALVPCPCTSGTPYPAKKDCELCGGTGKIMYGLADVEVV